MDKQKLFSVLFCSGMMLLYFFGTLYDRAKSRRGLALLLQSFIRAPHIEPVSKLSHFRGHSYMIQLEQDVLSAMAGKSPFLLLEDGRALPHPGIASHDEVRDIGLGRYIHINRRIYFAPSDNADLRQHSRKYNLLEVLTADPQKNRTLTELNARRAEFSNIGLWLLGKLMVYLDPALQIGSIAAADPMSLTITDAVIDTSSLDFGVICIGQATARWSLAEGDWSRLDIDLDTITTTWSSQPLRLRLSLDFTLSCDLRLCSATLTAGGVPWADLSLTWQDDRLDHGAARFTDLPAIRTGLTGACGDAAAHRRWLDDMVSAILGGDLSFGCRIDSATAAALTAALAPEAAAASLQVVLQRHGDSIALHCVEG
ncbi:hypothetical protein [Ferrovibrio xuzhouensis]|uniref:Uncharacterized protein n=1 Tax=Ferrovibrio xuzhouensis TaxID=1576914 RepID=A0ABV7VER9_9PROT